jgi:molybdopterin molybdotransferase
MNSGSLSERHRRRLPAEMLPFDEGLRRVLDGAGVLGCERVSLESALGRVLQEPLLAREPVPACDYSAMDGYALDSRALPAVPPFRLPIVGESRTGGVVPSLEPGSVCRIFTGAELPRGADAVIMQEDVEREGDHAVFSFRPAAWSHVRKRGADLEQGATALETGTRLGPGQLGLAAALDRAHVIVARRPRVTIVCTGDELRAPGSPACAGTIPDSNGVSIAALAKVAGAAPLLAPLTGDDREATRRALERALAGCDLLVTIGGVSVGDHDVVKPALEAAGAKLGFWKLAIKPGKPLVSGRAGTTRVLGLPGNPASAMVTFVLFGLPLLRALQGDRAQTPPLRRALLTEAVRQKPGRRGFLRATLSGNQVTPLANQASGAATGMAWANALIIVHEDSSGHDAGSEVSVLAFADA